MIIGGIEKFSLIDYPGHLSAIVFTKGCNFRCQYCYNPMLVWPNGSRVEHDNTRKHLGVFNNPEYNNSWIIKENDHSLKSDTSNQVEESDLFSFLNSRVGKLNGVVITGGEPTLHQDLIEFIKKIKDMGFDVKLDSNGTSPEVLKNALKSGAVDYVAMDIKAPLEKYQQVVDVVVDKSAIKKSIEIIKTSGIDYEFRSTIVPELIVKQDIEKMGEIIQGAKKWFLQPFKSNTKLVNSDLENKYGYTDADMEEMREVGGKYAEQCEIR